MRQTQIQDSKSELYYHSTISLPEGLWETVKEAEMDITVYHPKGSIFSLFRFLLHCLLDGSHAGTQLAGFKKQNVKTLSLIQVILL